MHPVAVLIVLTSLVGVTTVLGLVWRRSQGRVSRADGGTVVRSVDVPGVRGFARGATLLQFSTTVCSPCAAARIVLDDLAKELPGVRHIDLDITDRPDLASRFHIMQTPTTLILDRKGVVRARIGGAPRRDAVRDELTRVLAA